MNVDTAKHVIMPFGKYSGKTIDQVAMDDDGLRYLDWLRGDMLNKTMYGDRMFFFKSLCAYLDDPTIARELDEVLSKDG